MLSLMIHRCCHFLSSSVPGLLVKMIFMFVSSLCMWVCMSGKDIRRVGWVRADVGELCSVEFYSSGWRCSIWQVKHYRASKPQRTSCYSINNWLSQSCSGRYITPYVEDVCFWGQIISVFAGRFQRKGNRIVLTLHRASDHFHCLSSKPL